MSMVAAKEKSGPLPSILGLPVHVKSPRERTKYVKWTSSCPELFCEKEEKKKGAAPQSEEISAELAEKRDKLLNKLYLAEGIICEALVITENHADAWNLYEELCVITKVKNELGIATNGVFKAAPLVEQKLYALVGAEEKIWP